MASQEKHVPSQSGNLTRDGAVNTRSEREKGQPAATSGSGSNVCLGSSAVKQDVMVGMESLRVGGLYKIRSIPKQTKYYVFPDEMDELKKMQKRYYQYWKNNDAVHIFREYPYVNPKAARIPDMEVHISKKTWKDMRFVDRSLVQERAKERYMIRKIYEEITNESGEFGTGPLDIIREMLGKV